MTRLLGFLIEGLAKSGKFKFEIVVFRHVYDEVVSDLATLNCKPGSSYGVHTLLSDSERADELAYMANSIPDIEGWIVLYPYFDKATILNAPVAVIFPDSIPTVFPTFGYGAWEDKGPHTIWYSKVSRLLAAADRVITFSKHVARDQAVAIYGIDPERLRVVPHAPPNLRHLLPFIDAPDTRSVSRSIAANLLRGHAQACGNLYLQTFPFEDVPYIVVSTQDRPTKNIVAVARAVENLLRRHGVNIKLITTAHINDDSLWTQLPAFRKSHRLELDILSFPGLPREVHAALYHCAALTIHPSNFEGGHGPFPFYESVSVSTPALFATGPHVKELLDDAPELTEFSFDPNDIDELVAKVILTLEHREQVLETQSVAYKRLSNYSWSRAAESYCEAALGQ